MPRLPASSSVRGKPKKAAAPRVGRVAKDYDGAMSAGHECVEEMNWAAAALCYEEALACRPSDLAATDALLEVSFHTGDMDRAEQLVLQSIALAPESGYSKYLYLAQLREGAESAAAYLRGVELLKREAVTVTDAAEVARLRRELSDAYCSLADLYMTDLCDEPAAEDTCNSYAQMAVETDNDNPEACQTLANLRMCQSRNAEAVPYALHAVKLIEAMAGDDEDAADEDDATSGTAAGMTTEVAGAAAAGASAPAGTKAEEPAAQLPPFDARFALAKICMELEQYEAAVTLLDRLLAENDSNMEVFYLMGEAHYLLKDYEAAADYLTSADDTLTAAIDRIKSVGSKKRRGFGAAAVTAALVPDALMEFDLPDLESQRNMIRKLHEVVKSAAVAAGTPLGAGVATAGAGGMEAD